ncbi:MAG: D-glycerate dehydrogenase [Solirubrobacterales bacterium 70-9]|nr:MAG: D-glycerate dehydrogenase [Solirubrobacterales bacterium 70-9]
MPTFSISGPVSPAVVEMLRQHGQVVEVSYAEGLPVAELATVDVALTLLTDRVDEKLLVAAPNLCCVCNVAVGYDNVDLEAAKRYGVAVTNTPGVLDDATADLAMALLLAAARRLGEAERVVRSGRPWTWGMDFMLGRDLVGKRLGIIGLGGIGARVARRARGFGLSIGYFGRTEASTATELGAERQDLDQLLATSDFVSLHCPLTAETRHLIGARELALMKATAVLINTARGAVVEEGALVEALAGGKIWAAGLDVYEGEPAVHPGLLRLDRVVLAPHVGSATVETRDAMAELAARNAIAAANREPLLTPIYVPDDHPG